MTPTARVEQLRAEIDEARRARHLRNAVRTGTRCSYEPETPVRRVV